MELETFVRFARELGDVARSHTLATNAGLRGVTNKSVANAAFDPVTVAEKNAEAAMLSLILSRFADHSVAGEEGGLIGSEDAHYCWYLDPIDGTRSYVFGLSSWSTLIALLDRGQAVLGLIDVAKVNERYLGHSGNTVLITSDGEIPLRSSGCRSLADARFSTTDPFLFEGDEFKAFDRIRRSVKIIRYGLDGYAYAKLAAGTIDLVIESNLKPHDFNALIPIVRGAGGTIGDWCGGEDFSKGAIVAAATKNLYDEAVQVLAS